MVDAHPEVAFPDARNMWDTRFAEPGLLFGEEPNAFLRRESLRFAPGSSVLSVADGEGRNAIFLAACGHRVRAFDISPVGVAKARDRAAARGVTVDFRLADAGDWDWGEGGYDAVVAVFVQFAAPAQRERMFSGMWRSLRPGGLLLVEGYTPKQLDYRTGGPGKREHLYTEALLRDLLPQAHWLLLHEYEEFVAEGRAHFGRSALIDAVARKRAPEGVRGCA